MICTQAYVAVDFDEAISEFTITENEKGISFVMKEICRNGRSVIYTATPFFELDPKYFQLNFSVDFDQKDFESFNLSLENDVNYTHVSDYHTEFAPKEGAMTQSVYGFLSLASQDQGILSWLSSFFQEPSNVHVRAAIELHFHDNYDEV